MSIRSLDTAATGMEAQQLRLDQIANDVANVNTTSYKKGRTDFQDLLYQRLKDAGSASSQTTQNPVGIEVGVGVKASAIHKDFRQGGVNVTNNSFDFMINGGGFFAIQRPNGEIAYTRDGAFKMDAQGRLCTLDGFVVQPSIQVPPDALSVSIGQDGVVSVTTPTQENAQIGQIQVVAFSNPAGLKSVGANMYMPSLASGAPRQGVPGEGGLGTIVQGSLETSNVNIVESMVDMIKAQRAYEMNSKVMGAADRMMEYSINPR